MFLLIPFTYAISDILLSRYVMISLYLLILTIFFPFGTRIHRRLDKADAIYRRVLGECRRRGMPWDVKCLQDSGRVPREVGLMSYARLLFV